MRPVSQKISLILSLAAMTSLAAISFSFADEAKPVAAAEAKSEGCEKCKHGKECKDKDCDHAKKEECAECKRKKKGKKADKGAAAAKPAEAKPAEASNM